ncbi:hypothetical protein RJP21_23350 [Paenibacillus sp. VCA1]|uniref:hypothetical protein n=1 Tax=Paenibacillus sp. VCA1 TaxID=3039148 RepID=UPI0028722CBA|nr:hypothetical protein [Paenibacillus sp. VCA1]MDR9856543.1 hypothetical protein [Paenibacillus sp. VCA1]
MDTTTVTGSGIFAIIPFLIMLAFAALGITCMILFIRVAVRAIKALDIYLAEKSRRM